MTKEREYVDYLEDILDAILKISKFIEGITFDQIYYKFYSPGLLSPKLLFRMVSNFNMFDIF